MLIVKIKGVIKITPFLFAYIKIISYICTIIIKQNKIMESRLKVGDTVNWRGSWGHNAPQKAIVTKIEKDCNSKNGTPTSSIEWSKVNDRTVVVDLDNGHWAYGNQITQK